MNVFFHTHQGLGDQISCSSICHYLLKNEKIDNINIICRKSLEPKLKRLYDCEPRIKPFVLDSYPEHGSGGLDIETKIVDEFCKTNNLHLIRTGFERYFNISSVEWDFCFYHALGIPYIEKYRNFKLRRSNDIEEKIFQEMNLKEDYIFVHDEPDRNFNISVESNFRIVKNPKQYDIFDLCGVLQSAKELHMMGSSILCLCDVLRLPNASQKGYYYTFRGNNKIGNQEKWTLKT